MELIILYSFLSLCCLIGILYVNHLIKEEKNIKLED